MDGREAADNRVIFNGDVTGQGRHIRHNNVVAESHVVSDVRIGEDVVVVADGSSVALVSGAVDGYIFAKSIVVADSSTGYAPLPFEILRIQADAGKRENLVVVAERCVSIDDDMGM